MAELAVLKSTDPSAKVNEGDLGYFTRGRMVNPLKKLPLLWKLVKLALSP